MGRRQGGKSSFRPAREEGNRSAAGSSGTFASKFGSSNAAPAVHKRGPSKLSRLLQEPEDIEMSDSPSGKTNKGSVSVSSRLHSSSHAASVLRLVKDDQDVLMHRGAVATFVEISGLPPNPNPKDLLALLKRKGQKPFQMLSRVQFSSANNACYLHIKNKAQALALQAISGISYRDHKVSLFVLVWIFVDSILFPAA
jgi:hypothetical protein